MVIFEQCLNKFLLTHVSKNALSNFVVLSNDFFISFYILKITLPTHFVCGICIITLLVAVFINFSLHYNIWHCFRVASRSRWQFTDWIASLEIGTVVGLNFIVCKIRNSADRLILWWTKNKGYIWYEVGIFCWHCKSMT